jgi:hypothetical protein
MTYRIIRIYNPIMGDKKSRVIKTGLTLEEAQEHCKDPRTATEEWFDGYEKED